MLSALTFIATIVIFRRPLSRFGDWFTAERGANGNGWV
ncbi:hypothetical protein BDD41_0829 [Paracoccus versutus]|uniref:Uncharacterized protein n=1 Tax=Paracoccus versutus TaxID=34007 RepID=A0A3D9XZI8_PARVE|nr:hypothetical protein BDD41_0829 [Paracoccus versutus]